MWSNREKNKIKMSYSTILIQGPALSLKSNAAGNCRKQRSNVVCCCPWSGSDMEKKKNMDGLSQKKRYENTTTSLENFKVKEQHNSPFHLFLPTMPNQYPSNFITTFLLALQPSASITRGPNSHRRLPPRPSMLHLIGLSHYLIRSLPHHYPLRDLANKYGPLVYMEVGEIRGVIVSSAKIAKEVMNTHDPACADRPKVVGSEIMWYDNKDIFFGPYCEYGRQMRKLCISELLSPKKVESFEHIRKDEASALIESIQSTNCGGGVPFNLTEKIHLFMISVVCRAIFGNVSIDRPSEAIMSIRKAVRLLGDVALVDLFPSIKLLNFISWHKLKLQKSRRELDKILDGVIGEHRKNQGNGDDELGTEKYLIDVLLRMKKSGELHFSITDDNIKSVLLDLIVAGTDTSPATVDWAMTELMRNPRVMAKAQDEIRQAFKGRRTIEEREIRTLKYLKLVIKETLRLHPPISVIPRACREEVEIDGYHIPLNAKVLVNVWAIGRDPNYWHNPESFEPERFEANPVDLSGTHFEYIPFGAGKRMCPGMTFGLAKVEFLLAQLLYHFDWQLPHGIGPDDLDMTEVGGVAVSRKSSLYLIATPYNPANQSGSCSK